MTVYSYPGSFRIGVARHATASAYGTHDGAVEPKLQLVVLLSGHQRFLLDHVGFDLDARRAPAALMLRIARRVALRYDFSAGSPLVKVALAMPVDWLHQVGRDASALLPRREKDLAWAAWRPERVLCRLAGALAAEPDDLPRMALGLELLEAALAELARGAPRETAPVEAVRRYVHRHAGRAPSAEEVARACGIGLRTLERLMMKTEGRSLGTFLRDLRLDAAVEALHERQVTVAEAAWIAGYSSAANFATELRRSRGVSPGALRAAGAPRQA